MVGTSVSIPLGTVAALHEDFSAMCAPCMPRLTGDSGSRDSRIRLDSSSKDENPVCEFRMTGGMVSVVVSRQVQIVEPEGL